jgi:hypothetical protein
MPVPERPKAVAAAPTTVPAVVPTKISFLRAGSATPSWRELNPETPADATPEAQKKVQQDADAARKELAEYLHAVLTTSNLIVLVGSGASLGKVGGPSMQDLWNEASRLPNFKAAAAAVKHFDGDEWIENLMSRCQMGKQFLDGTAATAVSAFLSAAEKMIWTACSGFLAKADLGAHQTFLRRMARRRLRAPRLKLFTTNYDLCFETAAGQLGIIIVDGFSFSEPRRFDPRLFNYDIVRRAKGSDEANDFVEGVVQLFKVHGSVNWDVTESGIIQAPAPKTPCLIYPASTKYEQSYSQPHLELMAQFQSALREPNTCILTVGFGFNDNHLTAPILAAVNSNPSLKLLAVDRSARAKGDAGNGVYGILAKQIAGGESDISLLNADFSQFAELIPQLRALSPAEQMERSVKQIARTP